jgi:hypothetical protein
MSDATLKPSQIVILQLVLAFDELKTALSAAFVVDEEASVLSCEQIRLRNLIEGLARLGLGSGVTRGIILDPKAAAHPTGPGSLVDVPNVF